MANKNKEIKSKKPKELSDFVKMKELFIVRKKEGYLDITPRRLAVFTTMDKVILNAAFVCNVISILAFFTIVAYGYLRPYTEIDITTTQGQVYRTGADFNIEFYQQYLKNKQNNIRSNFVDNPKANDDLNKTTNTQINTVSIQNANPVAAASTQPQPQPATVVNPAIVNSNPSSTTPNVDLTNQPQAGVK